MVLQPGNSYDQHWDPARGPDGAPAGQV